LNLLYTPHLKRKHLEHEHGVAPKTKWRPTHRRVRRSRDRWGSIWRKNNRFIHRHIKTPRKINTCVG